MKLSQCALVLPFLTQQDLREVLVFANNSFFLISRFFIIIANLAGSFQVRIFLIQWEKRHKKI